MFTHQRLLVQLRSAQRGQIIRRSDIAEDDADVAEQTASLHPQDGTSRKASFEFGLGNFEEGVKLVAPGNSIVLRLRQKARLPRRLRKPVPGADIEAFVAAVNAVTDERP